jgi:hypothetical protein
MARANSKTAERVSSEPPITLLYIRRDTDELPELDAGLTTIVQRYAPMVELRPIEPADVDPQYAGWAERTPTVLVLRRGQVVGEAIGKSLPVRELDRVVGCAVEWAR